jgi:hypothetical protein
MNLDMRQITQLEGFREEVAFFNRKLVKVEPSKKRDQLEADIGKAQYLIEVLMPRWRWRAKNAKN